MPTIEYQPGNSVNDLNRNTGISDSGVTLTSESIELVTPLSVGCLENSVKYRFLRFSNPLVNYDYKCGHYLGIWDQVFPQLLTSFLEVTRGVRKPSWFFSDQYLESIKLIHTHYTNSFNPLMCLQLTTVGG